jgi:Peptidase A4 family
MPYTSQDLRRSTLKNRWLTLLVAGGASVVAAAVLPGPLATASPVTGAQADAGRPVPAVIRHEVTGCGRAMTLYTPRTSAAGLPGSALGEPGGPHSILAVAAQHHVRWLSALDCRATRSQNRFPATPRHVAAATSGNWSGYADETDAPPNYAQMYWTVPHLGPVSGLGQTDYSSIWPGIGSGGDGELIQDGTEQNVSCQVIIDGCTTGSQTDYFWIEAFPAEAQEEVTNLTPNPGDSVAAAVYWSSSTGAEFTLCDFTQNECLTGSQSVPAPDIWAEWIVERTGQCYTRGGDVSLPPLAPFGTVNVTGAGYDETPLGDLEYTIPEEATTIEYDMYDADGTQLDSTSGLGSGGSSFSVTWDNYGAASTTTIPCPS